MLTNVRDRVMIKLTTLGSAVRLASVTDANLTADPRVMRLIPTQSLTFMKIDHEIISMVILIPSTESLRKECCQLQAKVCAGRTG